MSTHQCGLVTYSLDYEAVFLQTVFAFQPARGPAATVSCYICCANQARRQRDNKALARLAVDDQQERIRFFDDPEGVTRNDRRRRARVREFLRRRKVATARDYFNAALIYQHGLHPSDYKRARALARTSIDKGGGDAARWLYAVACDRLLTSQGKPQRYGTQFSIVREKNPRTGRMRRVLRILPYSKTTTDGERQRYGIPPLRTLLADDGKAAPRRQKAITYP